MRPGGQLGDDAAGPGVERNLAGHGLGNDPARPVEEGDAGLVA